MSRRYELLKKRVPLRRKKGKRYRLEIICKRKMDLDEIIMFVLTRYPKVEYHTRMNIKMKQKISKDKEK